MHCSYIVCEPNVVCLSFDRYNFTDVQAMCETASDESSSSIRLLDVSSWFILSPDFV